jgi:molybdopterin-binding protein
MLHGEILQTGNWHQVFNSPGTRDIAYFVGVENIIDGEIIAKQEELVTIKVDTNVIEAISDYPRGEKVSVCIRPEDIILSTTKTSTSARNVFAGTIQKTVSFGVLTRVTIDCGFTLVVLVTTRSADELDLVKGKEIFASFKATAIHVIKR